ncbi:LOW QUALITY PROTEIN: hypothetical protein HID58_087240 [Brassica napus]|uniref:Uncharacterized protein n=1 Tax=Brassica napus TaxID=3708 RepID=A0ABQ7XSP7_BRANA|nr:LOW QUALITY PROTEIN: hypothetical protein HID58_087240 [Brassica napus]
MRQTEIVCIKGDVSAHTPDSYAAPVAILDLSASKTSECMGQDPGILRGRILARLRIRGMRRSSHRSPYCLKPLASSRDCALTFGRGDIQHVRLDNLVDSWYRSRILGHVVCVVSMPNREDGTASRLQSVLRWPCVVLSWNLEYHGHVFPESEDLEIHPSETHGDYS